MESLEPYLKEMIRQDASDLYLTVGSSPSLRVDDKIYSLEKPPLEQTDIDIVIADVLTDEQRYEFESNLELNIALISEAGERFRANFFRQQHHTGMVIRRIKTEIPTVESLNLPKVYQDIIMERRGLVLLVGSVGSGKSTSLSAMLEHRNMNGSGHIITIEDPIEFVHDHSGCIFTQREIGIDTYSYGIALKNALRQSPDVIVIGEIRDRETMENALLFCETGHLCLATLHANNSNQAIERIMNLFPEEAQKQALITLSQNLKAIFSQRLVENLEGGRSVAVEVLLNQALVRQFIEEGQIKEIKEVMEKSRDQGMQTFDQCLLDLINAGIISAEIGLREADNPSNLRLKINQKRVGEVDLSDSYETDRELPNPIDTEQNF